VSRLSRIYDASALSCNANGKSCIVCVFSFLTNYLPDLPQNDLVPAPIRVKITDLGLLLCIGRLSSKRRTNPIQTKLEPPFRLINLVQQSPKALMHENRVFAVQIPSTLPSEPNRERQGWVGAYIPTYLERDSKRFPPTEPSQQLQREQVYRPSISWRIGMDRAVGLT